MVKKEKSILEEICLRLKAYRIIFYMDQLIKKIILFEKKKRRVKQTFTCQEIKNMGVIEYITFLLDSSKECKGWEEDPSLQGKSFGLVNDL